MPAHKKLKRITAQTTKLALAVPPVVAHRVTRMATAGAVPDARDVREFQLMGSEKLVAFRASWMAMAAQMFRANQQMTLAYIRSWWKPWFGFSGPGHAKQVQAAALSIVSKGIAPVEKRAVANAKRLAIVKRR
ncbi:MAG: polyhydroxyalkanoate granule-associated phasin [Burkholderiales bacterium]